jgi:uncharacterized protein (TIGR01777 family)
MDYLITGATGFIGRKLVARLLGDGHEVNYLGRKRSSNLDSRAAFHPWNAGEVPPLDSVPTVDAVVNLAGEPVAQRWNKEVKRRIYESRVEGTRRLVDALSQLKHKPRLLISASATGYYGDRGDETLTEDSAAGKDFLADLCVAWEREALRAEQFGARVVLLRLAPVLGRGGGILAKTLPMFRSGLGGKLGSGKQWMPWIHMDDLIDLFLFAAAQPDMRGPYNATAPEPATNAQFTHALSRAVHRPAWFSVPQAALRLALGEAANYMVASERVLPKRTVDAGFPFQFPQLTAALRHLV